ncbi:MAG: sensor domain-containing diguanylate cyclase [Candidatus Thiodiazotropha taylori]|nr:sensor domain-containing diguanylate cyclase [Candidatus Thiodiazotropha taylori]
MSVGTQGNLVTELEKKIQKLEQENRRLKEAQVEINTAKELYLHIFQEFPALIWRANTEKLCDYFNTTWLNFTGRSMEQEYGNGWTEGVHPEDVDRCIEIYVSHFDRREPFSMEYRLKNRQGEYRWILDYGRPYYDLDGTFLGYIGSCYDITESRRNEQRLEKLSTTDALTKIYNRYKLDTVLSDEVIRSKRYGHALSLIIMDIDDFKLVNDAHGHHAGDLLLKNIAQILRDNIREADTLGRWGGEEFMVICPNTDLNGSILLADKLRAAIERYDLPRVMSKTASFGVASFYSGDECIDLVKRADSALYSAKNSGKNRVEAEIR